MPQPEALEIVGVVPDLQIHDPEDRAAHGVYASLLLRSVRRRALALQPLSAPRVD